MGMPLGEVSGRSCPLQFSVVSCSFDCLLIKYSFSLLSFAFLVRSSHVHPQCVHHAMPRFILAPRVSLSTRVMKRVPSFHASHKARVFRECENKNMKIFTSVASIWYAEDSKIDFTNENIAHGNRLLLVY